MQFGRFLHTTLFRNALQNRKYCSVASTAKEVLERRMCGLPTLLGFRIVAAERGSVTACLDLREELLAANGYCHAGTVITLADTACGSGTFLSLPSGAKNFTTIELKSNFLGTATKGQIRCLARLEHEGRSTQVWSAEVFREDGKKIALFRCTQMMLYPR
ncbi:hypothetical protein Gasu2_00390 [Galdieria sulphuraria]|uniref:Thioesterase superfamily protein n=1 Tax=Galdieria sulphuraria TaxID=130081 RepID=M2WS52_GALSU|nr:thioesterase superfamily protein [Galdieria sulphuraria]EME26675.1 thioesterase superfamily protein [Galdieria sulphuraria]GJD05578.1 hypothetical protein Gasu2_00390 [Galdieria sulphuraria]|eukprot:XP_005703195.1 thioesterase superfamily protein [Galdieria sulphuraria]